MPTRPAAVLAFVTGAVALCGCDARTPQVAPAAGSSISPVVQIQAARTNALGEASRTHLGSGFVVSEAGHLVTAYHVVEDFQQLLAVAPADERIRLVALPAGLDATGDDPSAHVEGRPLTQVAEDPANDLALLKAAAWPAAGAGVAYLALTPPEPGTPIELAGYPFGARELRTRLGRLVSVSELEDVSAAIEVPGWFEALGTASFLLAEVETQGGNSGSPVSRTDSGDVIGLCSAILLLHRSQPAAPDRAAEEASAPFTLVIPSRSIAALLDLHGVDWRAAD